MYSVNDWLDKRVADQIDAYLLDLQLEFVKTTTHYVTSVINVTVIYDSMLHALKLRGATKSRWKTSQ